MTTPGVGGIRLSQHQGLQISQNTITSATVGQNLIINQPGNLIAFMQKKHFSAETFIKIGILFQV